jgi:hypothetical protein
VQGARDTHAPIHVQVARARSHEQSFARQSR